MRGPPPGSCAKGRFNGLTERAAPVRDADPLGIVDRSGSIVGGVEIPRSCGCCNRREWPGHLLAMAQDAERAARMNGIMISIHDVGRCCCSSTGTPKFGVSRSLSGRKWPATLGGRRSVRALHGGGDLRAERLGAERSAEVGGA